MFGCKLDKLSSMYLGLPVGQNMSRVASWKLIIEKFKKKLNRWKVNTLSIGGRTILIRSILGSLGTYYLSLLFMPVVVAKQLESLRAKFFGVVMRTIVNCLG